MNTKMLMLGILLLAGLSFAAESWYDVVLDRYYCVCERVYYSDGFTGGLIPLAQEWGFYTETMGGYYGDMCNEGGDRFMMWLAVYDYPEPNTAMFRSNMLAFNSDYALFKREFNYQLRNHMEETEDPEGDREGIMADMSFVNEEIFMPCLAGGRKG